MEKEEMELALERKKKYKENLERELKLFGEQKPEVEKRKELHKEMIEILSKNHEIAINNFVFLKPNWKYEELPEYIENVRKLNMLNFEKTKMDWDSQKAQIESNLKSIDQQMETATTELEKVTKEIEELEKGE